MTSWRSKAKESNVSPALASGYKFTITGIKTTLLIIKEFVTSNNYNYKKKSPNIYGSLDESGYPSVNVLLLLVDN